MLGTRIEIVKMQGGVAADTKTSEALGIIDAVLNISPPAADESRRLKSTINPRRKDERASRMVSGGYSINDREIMGNNITLKEKLMYERDDMV